MNTTIRPSTLKHVREVLMDPRHLADWVTIHQRLGNVSDRRLRVGWTVEQTARTYTRVSNCARQVTDSDGRATRSRTSLGSARFYAAIGYELVEVTSKEAA